MIVVHSVSSCLCYHTTMSNNTFSVILENVWKGRFKFFLGNFVPIQIEGLNHGWAYHFGGRSVSQERLWYSQEIMIESICYELFIFHNRIPFCQNNCICSLVFIWKPSLHGFPKGVSQRFPTALCNRCVSCSIFFVFPPRISWNVSSSAKHNATCLLIPPHFLSSLSFCLGCCGRMSHTSDYCKCLPTKVMKKLKQPEVGWYLFFVYTSHWLSFQSLIITFVTIESWNSHSLDCLNRSLRSLLVFLFSNKVF